MSGVLTEMDAFVREAGRIEDTLRQVDPADWSRPGLGEWNLHELVAHLIRQADLLAAYRDRPLSGDRPAVDRTTYYRTAAEMAAAVAQRAREGAEQIAPEALPDAFTDAWRRSVAAVTTADALIETTMGPMRTDDFAATRVVELVVHHMDIRRAPDRGVPRGHAQRPAAAQPRPHALHPGRHRPHAFRRPAPAGVPLTVSGPGHAPGTRPPGHG